MNDGQIVEIPFSERTERLASKAARDLRPEDIQKVNFKRSEVLNEIFEMSDKYYMRNEYPKALRQFFLRRVMRTAQRVDHAMILHAKQMVDCKKWGVCTTVLAQAGLGFRRAFAATGAGVSWDVITKFGEDKWERAKYVDLEIGDFAHNPAAILAVGFKIFVHFDLIPDDIREFSTFYRLASPIRVGGQKTFGAGYRVMIGLPGFPFSLGMRYRNLNFRFRYDNAIQKSCEWLLAQKENFFSNTEDELLNYNIRLADGVFDDIQ